MFPVSKLRELLGSTTAATIARRMLWPIRKVERDLTADAIPLADASEYAIGIIYGTPENPITEEWESFSHRQYAETQSNIYTGPEW